MTKSSLSASLKRRCSRRMSVNMKRSTTKTNNSDSIGSVLKRCSQLPPKAKQRQQLIKVEAAETVHPTAITTTSLADLKKKHLPIMAGDTLNIYDLLFTPNRSGLSCQKQRPCGMQIDSFPLFITRRVDIILKSFK